MLLRKKLCLLALFCGILLFIFATYTFPKNCLLFIRVQSSQSTAKSLIQRPTQLQTVIEHTRYSCGCRTCVADPGISAWFDKRYNKTKQPYLTANETVIEPLALKWWLSLQQSVNGRLEDVVEKMFKVISSPRVPQEAPRPNLCRRCAVVGNSGNLLQFKYGAFIDSHPFIFRMNKAKTKGYEQYVGSRTTHHFMYPESAVDLDPGVHLVLLPYKLRDLQWVTSALSTGEITMTYMKVKERVKADKNKVIVVNPDFFKYAHERWTERQGRYPSTGMMAIIFALHLCDEVSVFGYGADAQGNWHHYWENNKYAGAFRKTGVHNAEFESKIIQNLSAAGKIKLYAAVKYDTTARQGTTLSRHVISRT